LKAKVNNLVNSIETQPAKKWRIMQIASKYAAMRGFCRKMRLKNTTKTQPHFGFADFSLWKQTATSDLPGMRHGTGKEL
jgi:hypothetical protein